MAQIQPFFVAHQGQKSWTHSKCWAMMFVHPRKNRNTNRDVFYILKFPKSNGIFVPFKKKKLGDESQISGKMNPQPGDLIPVSHGSLEVTVPNVDFGSLSNSKKATKKLPGI